MRFPIIKIIDKATKTERIVGTNIHDSLVVHNSQNITYHNLQNGESSV